MMITPSRKLIAGLILSLLFLSDVLSGQIYRFKNYGAESRLPHTVIYTLNQDENGYLWVGTSAGLSRFDGFEFHSVAFPDSSDNRYPAVSYKDRNGKLWFGCNDGSVWFTDGNNLSPVSVPNTSIIAEILEGPDGYVYVVPQRKAVFKIDPANPQKPLLMPVADDPLMFSASFTESGDLLLGTQEDLLLCTFDGDTLITRQKIGGFDYSSVTAIKQLTENRFIAGTDGNGLFELILSSDSVILNHMDKMPELETLSVREIVRDSEGTIWISTFGSGVARLHFSKGYDTIEHYRFLNRLSGLPGDNVTRLLEDAEGNYWIGFFGNGLSILISQALSYYTPGGTVNPNNIIFIGKTDNDYLLGTPTGYYNFDLNEGKTLSFTNLSILVGKTEIGTYYVDNDNNIWVGTRGNGLYLKDRTGSFRQFYRSGDSGYNYISDIRIDGRYIWLATLNGLLIINKATGVLVRSYNRNDGLPHNSINQISLTEDGWAYIATESDKLYRIHPEYGMMADNATMSGSYLNKITSIDRSSGGVMWAATYGNGLYKCYPDSVISFTTSDGLMSNYCRSVFADSRDQIWVGHERGFSKYEPETGLIKTFSTDFARGGECNYGGIYESSDGKIFIGTTEGLIIYDFAAERKTGQPPVTNINYVTFNNVRYPLRSSYSFPYRKRYAVNINFVGINFSDPGKVYYSTYLENYNDDWSDFSELREVTYSLSDGRYKFNLISVNEDGLSQDLPISFEILIKRPFWRAWWFLLLMTGVVTGIVIIIIREREKAQKKIQEYLESELEARTRVVRKQKAEIELQNMEITDSINYAKRIQSSILPDITKLKEHFRDAFIIFHPRDIVSGDFYWFDRFDEDKFILVCADSTGHGVPGAFMSMIGSTLLRDIVIRQRVSKPSEILRMLDNQIFSTLNQNLELGISNDGMDVVVCEFSLRNRHLRFASAMRPVILVLDGEPYYIKGNRSSVGGESVMEKFFDDQEYYLNEGDTMYLFSDGLPDQFGGPYGKKMKIVRLKKLIEEVLVLPMDEQYNAISKFYTEWKGDHEQVDDIILMGVKI
ncbi:MAG: SpoIIE family protein phosphatase [Bacteroidales bacterium]|nr:SpoIIE family protein phosphatase [Bacteroidales bacterium]